MPKPAQVKWTNKLLVQIRIAFRGAMDTSPSPRSSRKK